MIDNGTGRTHHTQIGDVGGGGAPRLWRWITSENNNISRGAAWLRRWATSEIKTRLIRTNELERRQVDDGLTHGSLVFLTLWRFRRLCGCCWFWGFSFRCRRQLWLRGPVLLDVGLFPSPLDTDRDIKISAWDELENNGKQAITRTLRSQIWGRGN